MAVSIDKENDICRLGIDGEMSIYTAAALKDALLQPLADCAELEVSLAGVSELDGAGLQLLLLLKREAARRDKALRLVAHSPATLEVLELCNLAAYFGDPLVIPAQQA
ncbi:MAG: STAS domain-containing protein [Pseudomonadota bacterium]|uniref:STAS domain-containing protein n=1 Tax=Thermithiobacillus tepidarius TaxID=929 RepID=UPI000420290E|nr:STAS domain-containing protein [Thermithiobacillus tepidarius]